METIVIASKSWKPQKKDPTKTYLNVKDTAGRWLSVFDFTVAKLVEGILLLPLLHQPLPLQ